MATLILKLDDREVQRYGLGAHAITIGRLPDNTVVIDNPAVSGRHARVYREGTHVVLEDLKSTNGTFVNDKPIARHALLDTDVVHIGKHTLVITHQAVSEQAAVTPDPIKPGALVSGLDHGRPSQVYDAVVPKTAIPTAIGRIGTLKVLEGTTSQAYYLLTAVTTTIGKSESAQIRVRGWFQPQVAAAIARRADGFTITPMGGKVDINGARLDSRCDLASGDIIKVGGLTLQFTLS